jgi:hypothetical protein
MGSRVNRLVAATLGCVILMQAACSSDVDKMAADAAAGGFHDDFNAVRYHEMYVAAADEFRNATSELEFSAMLANLKVKAGRYESSYQTRLAVNRSPAGAVVTQTFKGVFAKGAAIETFSWRVQRGEAVLLSYQVEPASGN